LRSGETDTAECKRSFNGSSEARLVDVIRSIAGMANNKGGMILFGVKDGDCLVEGMPTDAFERMDPSGLNRILAGALDPVPHVTKAVVTVGGRNVGVMSIEAHEHAPVIALKNVGSELKEGTIYYRYVGETRTIKPGELRQIIARREQRAVAEFSRRMMSVASGRQATLDLDTGEVQGTTGAFVIDKTLLPELQFIREGEFSEVAGSPALRLVGDVQPIDREVQERVRVIRDAVTPDAVIRNFLLGHAVEQPLQYIHFQAHCQRRWLPLWYYVNASGKTVDEIVADLLGQVASHPASRQAVINRLNGRETAYKVNPGAPARQLSALLAGTQVELRELSDVSLFANAVMGLPDDFDGAEALKPLLLSALTIAGDSVVRSAVYRSACRLDEILYRSAVIGQAAASTG
jgi:hypothetical protein